MKWVRHVVNDIDKFADDYNKLIKSGNGDLEAVRCFFKLYYNLYMKGEIKMSNEAIERLVEEIMRMYHMHNYDDYNNEELREHYRQILRKENA